MNCTHVNKFCTFNKQSPRFADRINRIERNDLLLIVNAWFSSVQLKMSSELLYVLLANQRFDSGFVLASFDAFWIRHWRYINCMLLTRNHSILAEIFRTLQTFAYSCVFLFLFHASGPLVTKTVGLLSALTAYSLAFCVYPIWTVFLCVRLLLSLCVWRPFRSFPLWN